MKIGLTLLSSLFFVSCAHSFGRKPPEPLVEWCSLYGTGGAECRLKDGTFVFRNQEELEGYLALTPEDADVYRKFCVRRRDK